MRTRKLKSQKQSKCVICNELFVGHGHNALPVKEGRCCTDCNWTGVLPARLEQAKKDKLKAIFDRYKNNNNNNNNNGDQK